MNAFAQFLWQNTLSISLLAALVISFRCLVGRGLPARWIWCFWLLLIVRLVAPITPTSSFNVFHLVENLGTEQDTVRGVSASLSKESRWLQEEKHRAEKLPESFPTALATEIEEENITEPIETSASVVGDSRETPEVPPEGVPLKLASIVVTIWAGGFLVCLGCFSMRIIRTRKLVFASAVVEDQHLCELLDSCREVMGIRRRVSLLSNNALPAPAITGVWRVRLFLPGDLSSELSDNELRHVFLHELAHVKRSDMLVQLVADLATALHWWNPLVWIARRIWTQDRELACDESAIKHIAPPDSPRNYGGTLLRVAESVSFSESNGDRMAVLAMALRPSEVSRRVHHIAATRRVGVGRGLATASVLAVLAATVATSKPPANTTPTKAGDPSRPFTDLGQDEIGVTMAIFQISELEGLRLSMVNSAEEEGYFQKLVKQAMAKKKTESSLVASFRTSAPAGEETELSDMTAVAFGLFYNYDQDRDRIVSKESMSRGVGTSLAFTAVPSADRSRVGIEVEIEHHYNREPEIRAVTLSGGKRLSAPPDFDYSAITSSATLTPGKTTFLELVTNRRGTFAIFIRAELANP